MTGSPALSSPHLSARKGRALVWGYSIYAVLSLVSMAAMSIGAAVLVVSLLYALGGPRGLRDAIRAELRRSDVRRYAYVMIALFVACAISLLGALAFPLEYGGKGPDVHFVPDLAKAWYLFWPLLLLPGLRGLGHEGRKPVLRAWILAFAVLSAIGVLQYYTGWPRPRPIPENDGHFHATLFLGHHLSVASIFIFPFFATLAFFRRKGPGASSSIGLPRWVLGLAAALGAMALFDTYSRALWIALPIGLLAWLLWSLPRRFSAGICVVLILGLGVALQVPSVKNRVFATRGITTREKLWGANWEFFKRRPLTGTGWHHNIEVSGYYLMDLEKTDHVFSGHAHNNVLDVLGGLGLIGMAAWLAWCGVTLGFLWRLAKRKEAFQIASALFCAWGVFQLNGLTQVNFWEAKVLHQMMWVVAWSMVWLGEAVLP